MVAFAAWTIFYEIALAGQFSMLWWGWPWIVLAVCLAVGGALHRMRAVPSQARVVPDPPQQPPAGPPGVLDARVLAAGLGVLVVLVVGRDDWGVWPIALTAMVILVAQVLPWVRRGPAPGTEEEPAAGPATDLGSGAHLFALASSIGLGIVGLFLLRPDADDAFYVNRATWVAERGTAATNDTMFSPDTLPPAYSGGLSTPSVEALQGVLAHAIGVQAPTLCYLLAVPVLGFLTGWTTWRLIREWAPRRQVLVLAASMLFFLASANSIVGNYSLGRIWQGKAAAYAILLPLVWLLLSRTVRRASRGDLAMLLAAGVSFVGLTTTSALLSPVICGAALLAAVLLRSRSLALGALAFLAAPLVNGLAQAFGPASIGGGGDNAIIPPSGAFAIAFGPGTAMVLLGLLAVMLVPRTVPGTTGVLLACGAFATMVGLLPGVFEIADALTGAGAVAWRLEIALPTWVLVGLLVALPRPVPARSTGRPTASIALAGVLGAVLIVPLAFGTWLWAAPGASLTSRPTWKVNQSALADVRAAEERDVPPGLWLMPPDQMTILAISRVGPFAVVPRAYYLPGLDVPRQNLQDRRVLLRLVEGLDVSPQAVRGALDRLDVSLACVRANDSSARRVLREAVREPLTRVRGMRCHVTQQAL